MIRRRNWSGFAALVGGLLVGSAQVSAYIPVNVEWRPATQEVLLGQTVDLRLYAVADGESDQAVATITVILTWNPAHLMLVPGEEKEDNGPYIWMYSGFPQAADLNNTYDDGDAYYSAWMQLGQPAYATPDGLLVTTLKFVALAETAATELIIIDHIGELDSRVTHGTEPGVDITGTLGAVSVTILPCGLLGDLDGDCDVDLPDYSDLGACLTGPGGGPVEPVCQPADLDGDDDVDLADVAILQAAFTGP